MRGWEVGTPLVELKNIEMSISGFSRLARVDQTDLEHFLARVFFNLFAFRVSGFVKHACFPKLNLYFP